MIKNTLYFNEYLVVIKPLIEFYLLNALIIYKSDMLHNKSFNTLEKKSSKHFLSF